MMNRGISCKPRPQRNPHSPESSVPPKPTQQLGAIADLNDTLLHGTNLYHLANKSLDYAFSFMGGQAGSLLLASPESQHLQFFLSKGEKPVPQWTKIGWDLGIAGSVFHSGRPEFVPDAHHDPRHIYEIDQLTGFQTENLLVSPIRHPRGHSMGVIEILNVSSRSLNHDDTAFLQIISSLIFMALPKSECFQREDLDSFIKDCAHDMKNLLMPILEGKEFLLEELASIFGRLPYQESIHTETALSTCKESLEMIDRNSKRLQIKAKDLVDCLMNRISVNNFKACALDVVTRDVLEALSLSIQVKKLTIEQKDLEELPPIQGDERKLFSVFYNLLHNAISAIQRGGEIGICGYVEEGRVCVNIVDNGPGISQQEVEMMFSNKRRSKKSLGNGYGMKSVRSAVEDHGGFIKVESKKGVGTTIHICFPGCPEPQNPPISENSEGRPNR